jgi:hypothetical protein
VHLALYFRDTAARLGIKLGYDSPKIDYGHLQKALTNLGPSDILARARTTGIQVTWVSVVEKAIEEFFLNESSYDISYLTAPTRFDYYVQRSVDSKGREELVAKGTKIPQQDRPVLPSKRTEEQQRFAEIRDKKYTEEELKEKMKDFRSRF